MRVRSELITIAVGAIVSNEVEIGNARIVGIELLTSGTIAGTDAVALQVGTGNKGQANSTWLPVFQQVDAGTFTRTQIASAAAIPGEYQFNPAPRNTLSLVRLKIVVAANGNDGTNIAGANFTARLILAPHGA